MPASIVDALERLEISETDKDDLSEEKIETLAEIICRAGDEPETKSAALFVLMSAVERSLRIRGPYLKSPRHSRQIVLGHTFAFRLPAVASATQ